MSRYMLSCMRQITRILFHLAVLYDSLRCGAHGTFCYGMSRNVIMARQVAAPTYTHCCSTGIASQDLGTQQYCNHLLHKFISIGRQNIYKSPLLHAPFRLVSLEGTCLTNCVSMPLQFRAFFGCMLANKAYYQPFLEAFNVDTEKSEALLQEQQQHEVQEEQEHASTQQQQQQQQQTNEELSQTSRSVVTQQEQEQQDMQEPKQQPNDQDCQQQQQASLAQREGCRPEGYTTPATL